MGCRWSPLDAMKAYMHTIQLCKDNYSHQTCTTNSSQLLEPKCIEFISALAAGNQAQLLVDIAHGGMSTSTLALAIAAQHTGGRLVCVRSEELAVEEIRAQIQCLELGDTIDLRVGKHCDVIKQYKNIDFAVIDHRIEDCAELLSDVDMNPGGSVVVVSNLFSGRRVRASYAQKGRLREGNRRSVVLPIGDGMEVTRIGRRGERSRRRRRIFMVYEE